MTAVPLQRYRWNLLPAPRQLAAQIARVCGASSIVSLLLAQRAGSVAGAEKFVAPSLVDLYSPSEMKDLPQAAERIARAVRNREKIMILGDYDADGVTATAIMLTILRAVGAEPFYYLPNRIDEGYGISSAFVERAIADKITLVVTVDCGTSEGDHIAELMASGIDVIVTDHHEPGTQPLPPSCAVLNPKRRDATYPFRELVGAGVAFKLAWGVCEAVSGGKKVGDKLQDALLRILPLAMIGTVADVAAMIDENRIIVHHGLKRLHLAGVGLRALLSVSGVNANTATCRDIGFAVAPRINAAGRLGNAELALRALLATDQFEADELAKQLDKKNCERKQLCNETLDTVEQIISREGVTSGALVVAAENLHEGVIGIAAGRMSERYNLPCAVISFNEKGRGKGSARSVAGVNLYAAVEDAKDLLLTAGGHEQAAGFSIAIENLPAFRERFINHCARQAEASGGLPPLNIDCEISFAEITDALWREFSRLAPFGDGNEQPVFLCRKVRIPGTPRLKGKEPKMWFTFNAMQNNVGYQAEVRQNVENLLAEIDRNRKRLWDLVFSLKYNIHYDTPRPELLVHDLRLSEAL